MADNNTRERIIETAVEMFSSNGYEAVSIRDIAGAVSIRESSIYYHFKSKKEILDTIITEFEAKAAATADAIITSISEAILLQGTKKQGLFHRKNPNMLPSAFMWVKTYYCDQFLFDPFSNSVMRILVLEQFHDEELSAKYVEWLFDKPRTIMLQAMCALGVITDKNDETYAEPLGSFLTSRIFHYLLSGKLTGEKCARFTGELETFISSLFGDDALSEING